MKKNLKVFMATFVMVAMSMSAQAQFPDAAGAANYGKDFAQMTLRTLRSNVASLRQAKAAAANGDEAKVREIVNLLISDLSEIEGYSDEIRSAAYWISLDRPDIDVTLLDFAGATIEAKEDAANTQLFATLLAIGIGDFPLAVQELELAIEIYREMTTLAELARDQSILIRRSL